MTHTTPTRDEAVRHSVADAINRARYHSPEPGLPERGVDEEDPYSQEYAFRLADAAIASLSPAATPVSEAGGEAADIVEKLSYELHCLHAGGRQYRVVEEALAEIIRHRALAKPASSPAGGDVDWKKLRAAIGWLSIPKAARRYTDADGQELVVGSEIADQIIALVRAALSQSTSADQS